MGDDDAGDDGRDDGEGVSRGGTPAPLSAGSGATPGGGAASSEVREASERAGTSGTRDEATGDDDGAGTTAEPTVRGRGKKSKNKGGMSAAGKRRSVGRGLEEWRRQRCRLLRRMLAFDDLYLPTGGGTRRWATTWAGRDVWRVRAGEHAGLLS